MKTKLAEKPFLSIQGEGNYIGIPAVFVRFSGCNLECPGCDTKYHKDGYETTTEKIIKQIQELNPLTKSVVFTGGEPLLRQKEIIEIIKNLTPIYRTRNGIPSYLHWWFQIETNGTISPLEINNAIGNDSLIQFNISPKLSQFNLKGSQIKLPRDWVFVDRVFKFVVSSEKDILEIKNIQKELNVNPEKIYLMPEGKTKKEQEEKILDIINLAIKYGFNVTPRLHILVWDSKRGV